MFFHLDPDAGTINDLNGRLTTFYETVCGWGDRGMEVDGGSYELWLRGQGAIDVFTACCRERA